MNEIHIQPWLDGVRGTQILPIINCNDDAIRVEAGPGTGKTFGLVRRVQRLLHPQGLNVSGRGVLIVAFNRVIAKQLQQDVDEGLGISPSNGKPVIRTVHALCSEVLGVDLRILFPHERVAMIYDVLCALPELSKKYKNHSKAEQALRDHEANHKQDMQLWQAVRQWLTRHRAELISELPNLLLGRIKGGDFQARTYQHVIVDEFQDLTPGEQQLFLQLKREGGTFMALGDPRQSIYAFRGNDREGLDKLDDLLGHSRGTVKHIPMTECHRCPEQIVEAANQLMGLYKTEPMIPGSNVVANTHVVVWKSCQAEAKGMAKAITDNIRVHQKGKKSKHLVMVTRRDFGFRLREQLSELDSNLKIELSFSESLLETWAVREAFLCFCLLVDPDPPTWRAWLGYKNSADGKNYKPSKRNADAYLKFLSDCSDKITELEVEKLANCSHKPRGSGGQNLWERAKRYVELKKQLQWEGKDALTFLEEIFDSSKWSGVQPADPETARLDMELIKSKACDICRENQSEHPESTTLGQLEEVASRLRYHIATQEPFAPYETFDLQITTLWGAKGLTADHVYVIGLCNEAIPGTYKEEYPGTFNDFIEERRRLFYVSITRSKETLVLSRALYIRPGDAARLGFGTPQRNRLEMSPYLHDIMNYLPDYQNGEEWQGCA